VDITGQLVAELKDDFSGKLILVRATAEGDAEDENVIFGSSNGGRMADVMAKMGVKMVKVTVGGWRPSPSCQWKEC
jgi:hypothetical protein